MGGDLIEREDWIGGSDGTRTRGLLRDRQARYHKLTSLIPWSLARDSLGSGSFPLRIVGGSSRQHKTWCNS